MALYIVDFKEKQTNMMLPFWYPSPSCHLDIRNSQLTTTDNLIFFKKNFRLIRQTEQFFWQNWDLSPGYPDHFPISAESTVRERSFKLPLLHVPLFFFQLILDLYDENVIVLKKYGLNFSIGLSD